MDLIDARAFEQVAGEEVPLVIYEADGTKLVVGRAKFVLNDKGMEVHANISAGHEWLEDAVGFWDKSSISFTPPKQQGE